MPIKYILQKDVPERMSESNFGLKHIFNKRKNHIINRQASD